MIDNKYKNNSVYKSLKQSLKEVKLIREGKIETKTWEEFYKELKKCRR